MKTRKRILCITFVLIIGCLFAACSDDGGGGGGSSEDESVQITNEVEGMNDYPADAQPTAADGYEVNGQPVSGTDATRIDDTDENPINTSVTIPATLARSGDLTVFGYWLNGKMTKTAAITNFDLLMDALQVIFTDFIDTSVTDKIVIDDFPVILDQGDNYFFFYFEDSSGTKYRTPIVAVKFDPTGGLLKNEEIDTMDELEDFESIDE